LKPTLSLITAAVSLLISPRESTAQQKAPAKGFVIVARLGDCWSHAIDHYYKAEHLATLKPNNDWYPPSIFFQGMKYMVFGDPTLRLPLPERSSK
jgi:hypothetical protein